MQQNQIWIEEVANILKVTRRTIYNYIKSGDLKAVKMGKYWRVSEANLQDFIEHGTNKKS
ncbi:helix-turn-helix domain-containing protein [Streptococcus alactolyticus]|uniref:helix-turn-helix domain-containing protein n=1 Tax=Streptococcus alactolyticus TaxID=29389 RepID=UPI003F97137F